MPNESSSGDPRAHGRRILDPTLSLPYLVSRRVNPALNPTHDDAAIPASAPPVGTLPANGIAVILLISSLEVLVSLFKNDQDALFDHLTLTSVVAYLGTVPRFTAIRNKRSSFGASPHPASGRIRRPCCQSCGAPSRSRGWRKSPRDERP